MFDRNERARDFQIQFSNDFGRLFPLVRRIITVQIVLLGLLFLWVWIVMLNNIREEVALSAPKRLAPRSRNVKRTGCAEFINGNQTRAFRIERLICEDFK